MKIIPKTARRMRGGLIAAMVLIVSGCEVVQRGQAGRSTVLAELFETLSANGNPVMVAGAGQGTRVSVLVRDTLNPPHETWISAEGVSATFHSGILNATRGFGHDLMSADVQGTARLIHSGGTGQVTRVHRNLDGEDQIVITSFVCDISTRGLRDIEIAGRLVATRLVEEKCTGPGAEFTNLFWLRQVPAGSDPGDTVVQSRQWAGPETGLLDMRLVAE